MQYDRSIQLATAGSRKATRWPASIMRWSELVQRLAVPVRSTETLQEYLQLSKSKQDDLKDVGGFVAGTFHGWRRKADAVSGRDVVTLDLDNIPPGGTDDILSRLSALGCAYVVYSTRKHDPAAPRLRVLLALDRTVTADEYEPIARKIAALIGLEFCDPTTFEASRLMYWPSCCSDSAYVYRYEDKPFVSADGLLSMYASWQDVTSWPEVPGETDRRSRRVKTQADPMAKQGVVGAFCRTYDVPAAIDVYLADRYEPAVQTPNRYTFLGGSTTGGAVVYDAGRFLFSHHATDPASGQLVNAFDLVRLHLFGDKDDEAKPETPGNRLPSFIAMCEIAVRDEQVATLLNQERYLAAREDFAATSIATDPAPVEAQTDVAWMNRLDTSAQTGAIARTIKNIVTVLEFDPGLQGKIAYDEFSNRGLVLGSLPWDKADQRRGWADADDAALREYLERVYGLTGKDKIFDAITVVGHRQAFNDVKQYLDNLQWDGLKRLDTVFIDYFGAADDVYTRAVARKFFAAAVARVYQPGIKFDNMPILSGPQGCGKSTFLARMGRSWYTDSLTTFEGKDAAEMVQGMWIVEIGELSAMSRSETNSVKQFLSRIDDVYRAAYGRRTDRYPRRCVFCGTTNDAEFLKDKTGNRRFWPIDLHPEQATKNIFKALTPDECDQLWAEAVVAWRLGERLYLIDKEEEIAKEQQDSHRESNAKEGLIREWLEQDLPPNWDAYNLQARRIWWADKQGRELGALTPRDRVCALEIWCECFGSDAKFFQRKDAIEINGILETMSDWKRTKSGVRYGADYGYQRGFERDLT